MLALFGQTTLSVHLRWSEALGHDVGVLIVAHNLVEAIKLELGKLIQVASGCGQVH